MSRRFADTYRSRGGTASLKLFDGQPHTFITKNPPAAVSREAIDVAAAFILEQAEKIRAARGPTGPTATTSPLPHP
jgi:hypothetical protein